MPGDYAKKNPGKLAFGSAGLGTSTHLRIEMLKYRAGIDILHVPYRGSADDRRDGFIHFSTAAQVAGTVAKHFAGQTGLFLIAVDADALGEALKWEPSRGGALFPHLYGELDIGAVTAILDLRSRSDGSHDIPELVP